MDYALLLAGAFAGGFVSGLAGFGTGLVALGFWLHAIPPIYAAPLVAFCSVASQAQTAPMVWRSIDWPRIWPMLVAGLLGIPFGVHLLTLTQPDMFRVALGLFLIVFSTIMLLARDIRPLRWGGRLADAVVGFAGGLLGGLAGLSGPLPTVWATVRGWTKNERRGVFQMFNLTILAAVSLIYLVRNGLPGEFVWLLALALPGTAIGTQIGAFAYRRLSDRQFDRIVLSLLCFSGVVLVVPYL